MNERVLFLRQATADDVNALKQLLDRCYRQDEGWTNESDLVGGIRTSADELATVIADPKHYVFVYPKTDTGSSDGQELGELLGCIGVDIKESSAYIGMFAVHPELQGHGVGHEILQAAETFADRHLQSCDQPRRLTMSILSHRPELLAYYERRGYKLTGVTMPFPEDGNNGDPKRQDLQLLELKKTVGG